MMIFFYLLVAILPLSDHHILGRSYGGITIFKLLGAICVVHALAHKSPGHDGPGLFKTWQARLSVLFLLITMTSFLLLPEHRDFSVLWSCVSFLAFFVATVPLVDSVQKLRRTLLWAIGSVAVASIYVIKEWWQFHNQFGADFRPGGATGDSNYFAMSALLGVILAYHLAIEKRPPAERLFALICLCITLIGLSLAASRGGFLGLAAAFLYLISRSRRRARNLSIAAALTLPFVLLLPSSPLNRFTRPTEGDRVGQEARLVVWRAGRKIIEEHPLFGIGVAQFRRQVERYEDDGETVQSLAHNTYIEVAAEMGLPVLCLFVAILACAFMSLEHTRRMSMRTGPRLVNRCCIALQASLLGYSVCLFFLSGEYQKHLWFMIFLSIPFNILVGRPKLRRKIMPSSIAEKCSSLAESELVVNSH